MKITFVFPVYNGSEILEDSVSKTVKKLDKMKCAYEIIISENGSTDKSIDICRDLSRKFKRVRFISSKKRGKGLAIKNALREARGDAIIFTDIDLSMGLDSAGDFIKAISDGHQICIGSRYMKSETLNKRPKRAFFSKSYIMLARILFRSRISDFQCGFKAFSRSTVPLLLKARSNTWFWDSEVLLEAERSGIKIKEIPVYPRGSVNSTVSVMSASSEMLKSLFLYRMRRLVE